MNKLRSATIAALAVFGLSACQELPGWHSQDDVKQPAPAVRLSQDEDQQNPFAVAPTGVQDAIPTPDVSGPTVPSPAAGQDAVPTPDAPGPPSGEPPLGQDVIVEVGQPPVPSTTTP